MKIEKGNCYSIKFRNSVDVTRIYVKSLRYLLGGNIFGGGVPVFSLEDGGDFAMLSIPESCVSLYEPEDSTSDDLKFIVLSRLNCGDFEFVNDFCIHSWVDTGMKWTYCNKCGKDAWINMGVVSER